MKRSMPTMTPTPLTRSGRNACRPPARVARPAPVTPAAPLEAMIMNTSRPICSGIDIGIPIPVAMNSDAIVR
jgi:urease accessory protein UreH